MLRCHEICMYDKATISLETKISKTSTLAQVAKQTLS